MVSTDRGARAEHARRRLAIEAEDESRALQPSLRRFIYRALPPLIAIGLGTVGLLRRARRNALAIRIVENALPIVDLPEALDGLRLLHLTDMHVDFDAACLPALIDRVTAVDYDVCVLTGDFRADIRGPIDATIDGMRRLRAVLSEPIYAVLGNHDSLAMIEPLEAFGVRVLLNEVVELRRGDAVVTLAGIDDAHHYRLHDIARVAGQRVRGAPSILLSHTPEVYREAEAAGFDAMLSGHTHGGQLCLPGGHPVTLDADLPRRLGRGGWRHGRMVGYTSAGSGSSIAAVRLNCPPEITLHRLRRVAAPG